MKIIGDSIRAGRSDHPRTVGDSLAPEQIERLSIGMDEFQADAGCRRAQMATSSILIAGLPAQGMTKWITWRDFLIWFRPMRPNTFIGGHEAI